MPVMVYRPQQPEMTTPQALAQQAQGLYARAASLLHGIAEERPDEVDSPCSYKESASTCSTKEVIGQSKRPVAIGRAVMCDGQPPSKVGLCDTVLAANLTAAEKEDRLENLQCRMLHADAELSALREEFTAAETLQATQRTGYELQLSNGDTKLQEVQSRSAALEAHQALDSLRESHARECEKAAHLLNVANGEAREEALLVEFLRTEATKQSAHWEEDREKLLGDSHHLQARLQECGDRLTGLESLVEHASESAARSASEQLQEVEALELARSELSRMSSHAGALEQERKNDAEAHNATTALVELELQGFEERVAAIQHEADQVCALAKMEAREEAEEAAEAIGKLRTIERERAEDVEAAFRMHADARQALEHLCHFVGRRQGEDDAQARASAEVAAASAEAAGLREELHHHFHAQHDLRQELSALSSAAAEVHSATEAKDEIIMRLEAKVAKLSLQQLAGSAEHQEEGPPPRLSEAAQLESSRALPAQQRTSHERDLAVTDLWRAGQAPHALEHQASEVADGDTPSVNNLGTWRSDVLTSSAGSVELRRSSSKPLIESSGSPEVLLDTPQLGTRELPDSNLSADGASAATHLQQLTCCQPGAKNAPSAVAAAAVTAVKAALASFNEDKASKHFQNGDAKEEVRLCQVKAPSMCSTGSSPEAAESPAVVPFPVPVTQENTFHEEYKGCAQQQQQSMTEDLKNDIARLRRILFEKNSAFLQLQEDAKKLIDGRKDPRVASPNGQTSYPKSPEGIADLRVALPNGPRILPAVPQSPDAPSAPSFVAPNINQFVHSKSAEASFTASLPFAKQVDSTDPQSTRIGSRALSAEVLHSPQDAMPPKIYLSLGRQKSPSHSGETTPHTRDRTVSPHPRDRIGSMHSTVTTTSDSQSAHPVPHPIPHRRGFGGLAAGFHPQVSCESDTCTPLCRSQQTLPPDTLLDQTPSTPGVIDHSTITVNQEAAPDSEPKLHGTEMAAAWDSRPRYLAKSVEASAPASFSISASARAISPLRHGSPTPVPWRRIQAGAGGKTTARSIDTQASTPGTPAPPPLIAARSIEAQAATPGTPAPPAAIAVAQSQSPSLQHRYTTPPPGRLTPTSGKQRMPPGSLPVRPQSQWHQRVSAACSIQTLEQTLQTLKLRAQTPTPSSHALGIGEAVSVRAQTPTPSSQALGIGEAVSVRAQTPTPSSQALGIGEAVRAQTPTPTSQALGIGEAPVVKPPMSSQASSASMASPSLLDCLSRSATPPPTSSMSSLLLQKAGEKSSGSMLVARQTTFSPAAVPSPQAIISGSSDGLRQVVRVASPLAKRMSERDCSPTNPPVSGVQPEAKLARTSGRFTATPRVTAPAGGAHSVSPQPQRLTAPTTPPVGSGIVLHGPLVCWQQSSRPSP